MVSVRWYEPRLRPGDVNASGLEVPSVFSRLASDGGHGWCLRGCSRSVCCSLLTSLLQHMHGADRVADLIALLWCFSWRHRCRHLVHTTQLQRQSGHVIRSWPGPMLSARGLLAPRRLGEQWSESWNLRWFRHHWRRGLCPVYRQSFDLISECLHPYLSDLLCLLLSQECFPRCVHIHAWRCVGACTCCWCNCHVVLCWRIWLLCRGWCCCCCCMCPWVCDMQRVFSHLASDRPYCCCTVEGVRRSNHDSLCSSHLLPGAP